VESVAKSAYDLGIAPFFWDEGKEYNRQTYRWTTDGLGDAMKRATSGQSYVITKH
jgi:hypothetical protein